MRYSSLAPISQGPHPCMMKRPLIPCSHPKLACRIQSRQKFRQIDRVDEEECWQWGVASLAFPGVRCLSEGRGGQTSRFLFVLHLKTDARAFMSPCEQAGRQHAT
eukprot:1159418-Pelagomonas_calceolata.AAC.2